MSYQEVIHPGGLRIPKMSGWLIGFGKETHVAYYPDEVKFKITFYICKRLTYKVPMDCQILHKML